MNPKDLTPFEQQIWAAAYAQWWTIHFRNNLGKVPFKEFNKLASIMAETAVLEFCELKFQPEPVKARCEDCDWRSEDEQRWWCNNGQSPWFERFVDDPENPRCGCFERARID